ncbi:Polyglutamine-binding protein 1, partial [Tyrophagus putrescentiae]
KYQNVQLATSPSSSPCQARDYSTGKKVHEEEEVIAEDYDDVSKPDSKANVPQFDVKICNTVPGCPNKYNIYHNCTGYCATKYADVPLEPSKMIRKKFERLLKKYPLTDSAWEQVYEPGLKTFYFWNTRTDQVSWLPPSHPDAKITLPAEKLRSKILSAKQQHQQRRQAISRVNQLDPMDPAAYSNIPRGKWSDGLRNNDD